jgi:hypothetical protein
MSRLIVDITREQDLSEAVRVLTAKGLDKAEIEAKLGVNVEQSVIDEVKKTLQVHRHWKAGLELIRNEVVIFQNKTYRVLQAHTSQSNWTPNNTASLFVIQPPVGIIPNWSDYPTSSTFFWRLNDIVNHNGKTWISRNDANTWEPGTVGNNIWQELPNNNKQKQ